MSETVNEATIPQPVQEETVTVEPTFDGMTNREALEKAVSEKREEPKPEEKPAPSTAEVKQAVEDEIDPPAEFSAAGKKAWKDKDIRGIQKEYRRIHDARTQEITRAQTEAKKAREESQTWRDLGKMAAPYIEARGQEGVSPDKAIMEALALINEFKKGDPQTVKAELKKIGIDLDKAPESKTAQLPKEVEEKITGLQSQVETLIKEKEAQNFREVAQTFESIFTKMASEKTRTGEPVFPDINDTEAGVRFATELGSLTRDTGFQSRVLRRLPDANLETVVREAYRDLGGRVSGEPVKVSQSNQQQIDKSRRAAAAAPGRVVASRNDASNLAGKLTNRAALVRALEESRGH